MGLSFFLHEIQRNLQLHFHQIPQAILSVNMDAIFRKLHLLLQKQHHFLKFGTSFYKFSTFAFYIFKSNFDITY